MMTDNDAKSSITTSHNNIVIRYAIATGLLAVLAVAVNITHYRAVEEYKITATVINLSGMQRMLSQRAALFSLRLFNSRDPAEKEKLRKELMDIAGRMEKSHNGFMHGDAGLGLTGKLSPQGRAIFMEAPVNLDAQVRSYLQIIRKVATAPESGLAASASDVNGILHVAQGELVNSLDFLVQQYESESKISVADLQQLELAFIGAILMTVIIASLFIFLPALKQLNENTGRLLDSRQRLSDVLDVIGEAIIVADETGKIVQANREASKVWGYGAEELIGANVGVLMPEDYREAHQQGLARYVQTGVSRILGRRMELDGQKKDKTVFPLEITITHAKLARGGLFTAAARDLTEAKLAGQERERLVTAIHQATEAIVITGAQGIIQYVNPAFENTTGYKREEAIGRNPGILKSGKQDDAFYKNLWETISGGDTWKGRFINKKKNGELFEEEGSITPVKSAAGEIVNYIAVKRDITRESKLERQTRKTQRLEALGSLAAGIAHDFNNLLSPIIAYTEMAIADLQDRGEIAGDLREVVKAAGRARDIVKHILTFGRESEHEKTPVMIHLAVKEALKLARVAISANIEIIEELDSQSGYAMADPSQVSQVVMNVSLNAAYAMRGTGGRITISVAIFEADREFIWNHPAMSAGKYVRITISDTGPGMDEQTQERIFEPFFTTKPTGEGTGLGLSVVHGIVKGHGGEITVYSQPGEGATFNIYFPATEEKARAEDEPAAFHKGYGSILLVDDTDAMLSVGGKMLTRLGYKVTAVSRPKDALELFRKSPEEFDALVTDQTMPGMTGVELAAGIMKIRPGFPVALCTGFSDSVSADKAREIGVREFMMKPYGTNQFAEAMRRLMGSTTKDLNL
ncbi:MAG: PAS domain S-box protein [Nitrospinae bacterium]|nr:PAS domain S-box protein [Nitrospinota bacterium]